MAVLSKAVFASAVGLIALGTGAAASTTTSRWLDAKPVANWNKPGATIPRGPKAGNLEDIKDCEKRGAAETKKSSPRPRRAR